MKSEHCIQGGDRAIRDLTDVLVVDAPGSASAGTRLVSVQRSGADQISVEMLIPGDEPLVMLIHPPSMTGPCFLRTPSGLCIRYQGKAVSSRAQKVLAAMALRLRGADFETLGEMIAEDPQSRVMEEETDEEDGQEPDVPIRSDPRWQFRATRALERNAMNAVTMDVNPVHVLHSDLECRFSTPRSDGRAPDLYCYPWVRPLERRPSEAQRPTDTDPRLLGAWCTDMGDADAIMGGGGRLEKMLHRLEPALGDRDVVAIKVGCLPHVIGDDVDAALERWNPPCRVHVSYPTRESDESVHSGLISEALARGVDSRSAGPPSVNVVGLRDGGVGEDLLGLLERAGIRVNCACLPRVKVDQLARYRDADMQVIVPVPSLEPLIQETFARQPLRTIRPAPPFGLQATRSWLHQVAAGLDRQDRMNEVWEEAWHEVSGRLEDLSRRARGICLGFVLDEEELTGGPLFETYWGVPLVPLVLEMGFCVELMVHGGSGRTPALPPGLEEMEDRIRVTVFEDMDGMHAVLGASECQAVYSDFWGDERILAHGKGTFCQQHLEPGLHGAVVTMENLMAACRVPFVARYGRYLALPGEDGS